MVGALDTARLAAIRRGCDRVVWLMVARDPERIGNRGSHRYTFRKGTQALGSGRTWRVSRPCFHGYEV